MRKIFDENKLQMVYGYANLEDNDDFTLSVPERYQGLKVVNSTRNDIGGVR